VKEKSILGPCLEATDITKKCMRKKKPRIKGQSGQREGTRLVSSDALQTQINKRGHAWVTGSLPGLGDQERRQ